MIQIKGWGMSKLLRIRPINKFDYEAWLPLWNSYNAFYGRHGSNSTRLNYY